MNFTLATAEHEPELRALLGADAMPGWIRLATGREPDFFRGAGVHGRQTQVLVAIRDGRVVAMGCRARRPMFVNGEERELGYLGGLRLSPAVRGTAVLAAGYAALKRLHEADPVPAYITTVIEGNTEALRVLTGARAGLPRYLNIGRYLTYAISLRGAESPRPTAGIRRGSDVGWAPILAFLREEGRRRQFFPAFDSPDFGTDVTPSLRLDDFAAHLDAQARVSGVAALWDQSSFKQTFVRGYAPATAVFRPIINLVLQAAGFTTLPRPGSELKVAYVTALCVRENDIGMATALLEKLRSRGRTGGHDMLLVGLHERDPLNAAVRRFPAFRYPSRAFVVAWEDGQEFVRRLDPDRVPYLELAML